MAYKQLLMKIDENLLKEFQKACGSQDISEVMIKLIKGYIKNSVSLSKKK